MEQPRARPIDPPQSDPTTSHRPPTPRLPLRLIIAAIAVLGMIAAPLVLAYLGFASKLTFFGESPTEEEDAAGDALLLSARVVALSSALAVWVLTLVRLAIAPQRRHGWEILWSLLALPVTLVGLALVVSIR